jgi:hypothetical protein
MDGWMDEWMDEWMDGWMNGWMDGWMDGWMNPKADRVDCCLGSHSAAEVPVVWSLLAHLRFDKSSLVPPVVLNSIKQKMYR